MTTSPDDLADRLEKFAATFKAMYPHIDSNVLFEAATAIRSLQARALPEVPIGWNLTLEQMVFPFNDNEGWLAILREYTEEPKRVEAKGPTPALAVQNAIDKIPQGKS